MSILKKKNYAKIEHNDIQDKNSGNNQIMVITYLFVILFVVVIIYLAYFVAFKSESVINNTYNSRGDILKDIVVRGNIIARNGEIFAKTDLDIDNTEVRVYPYDNLFAHVVGYCSEGNIGIESIANINLLTSNSFITNKIQHELNEYKL